jgi:hypothetical protein
VKAPHGMAPVTGGVTISGLDGIAANLPTNDWYVMRIVFRRVPSGVEVRADKTIQMAMISPEDGSENEPTAAKPAGFDPPARRVVYNEALEEAAKVCETHAVYHVGTAPTKLVPSATGEPVGHLFADAIRALKVTP